MKSWMIRWDMCCCFFYFGQQSLFKEVLTLQNEMPSVVAWLFYSRRCWGLWANSAGLVCRGDLLGLGGNRVQLLQWMISLTRGTSWETGAGTIPRPGIMGLRGVIPAIMPRLGSKSGGGKEMRMRSHAGLSLWKRRLECNAETQACLQQPTFGHVLLQPIVSCPISWFFSDTPAAYPQWITQRVMNKTFGKQHAYLKKF